jgi:NADH-quinone oxidoreductase subunit M
MIQRTFQGPNTEGWRLPDLSVREIASIGVLVVAILWLGLFPQPVLNATGQALNNLQQLAPKRTEATGTQQFVFGDGTRVADTAGPGGNR